jgi:hypothetical protein
MARCLSRPFLPGHLLLLAAGLAGSAPLAGEAAPALPPPTLTLTAPREVLWGEDATFAVVANGAAAATVNLALKTYAGETVWSRNAPLTDGRATVVLPGAESAPLEKGSRVLVAALEGAPGAQACRAVRLRGRVFENVMPTPADLQPGAEIVITDLARLQPAAAIADVSTRGKWWRRPYQVAGEAAPRALVCVAEHDLDDPGSCLAGQLTLPLGLQGWFEVWVRTYRDRERGGVDVRLSNEPYFLHADPLQVDGKKGVRAPEFGALVDVLYRAADLTGQDLVFQQPYGTYASEDKRCNAALAGVRLVKLSAAQVAKLQAERARADVKCIGYDDDGFSYFWQWAVHDEAVIARLLEPLRDQSAAWLNISLGGLGGITIPTPYTEIYQMTGHVRDGDLRVNDFYRWCFENKVNIVDVLANRAHQVNLKLFVSLMAERCFSPDKTVREHPEWRVSKGEGTWDYALPAVQDYQVTKIAWIAENHPIDGFIVDFTRYGHYFNENEPNKFQHMNAYLRKLRAAFDALNARKERKVLLCGSFGERSWHLLHWGTGVLADQGLDVQTWLKEGLFDIIMPEGPTAMEFVDLAKTTNSRTAVWPRKVGNVTFEKHTERDNSPEGPKEIERGAKYWFDHGAPGIFFFNHPLQTSLGRLGFAEERDLRAAVDEEIYGLREGPVITFVSWYPDIRQENEQREALRPLTVVSAPGALTDAAFAVPLRNVLGRSLRATVRWLPPTAAGGEAWAISPADAAVDIAAGGSAELTFRAKGTNSRYASLPRAMVELADGDQVVFRHTLPLRAVPQLVCRRITATPGPDGRLAAAAWDSLGARQACALLTVGKTDQEPAEISAAVAYDDQSLYLNLQFTGDVPQAATEAQPRTARQILAADTVQVLLEPAGMEQRYRQFAVTPTGAQAEGEAHYDGFLGAFTRALADKPGAWTAWANPREKGYAVEMAIPFKLLKAAPQPGEVWRLNLVATSRGADGKTVTRSWSSHEAAFDLPRHFGTLFGTLRFE